MTLAEIFLLLLIVGWYGMRLESEGATAGPPTPEAVLRAELNRAQEAAKAAEHARDALELRIKEHERMLRWIQDHFGGGPSADLDTLKILVAAREEAIRTEARRGKPACSVANVLVRVVADEDAVSLTLLEDFAIGGRRFAKGSDLRVEGAVTELLNAIGAYYAQQRQSQRACAYDYELEWRTDRDYRAARQQFERYFYPARLTQLQ